MPALPCQRKPSRCILLISHTVRLVAPRDLYVGRDGDFRISRLDDIQIRENSGIEQLITTVKLAYMNSVPLEICKLCVSSATLTSGHAWHIFLALRDCSAAKDDALQCRQSLQQHQKRQQQQPRSSFATGCTSRHVCSTVRVYPIPRQFVSVT